MSSWRMERAAATSVSGVKRLALGAVLVSALLLLPPLAGAELVPGSIGATDSLLAVGADGLPDVAFDAANGSVVLAARAADGTWAEQSLPGSSGAPVLLGLELAPTGAIALLEASDGSRLALAEQRGSGWRLPRMGCSASAGSLSAPAGARTSPTPTSCGRGSRTSASSTRTRPGSSTARR
jgi:hypothetical protein